MSSIDSQNLEAFLLSENKQDFLKKLIPGTEPYYFFSLLHALNTSDHLTPEVQAQFEDYKSRVRRGPYVENIQIKTLLRKYDESSTKEEEKTQIIDQLLQTYLRFTFEYSKPSDITTSTINLDQKALPSSLDERIISLEHALAQIKKNPKDIKNLQPVVYSRLDVKDILQNTDEVWRKFILESNPSDIDDLPNQIIDSKSKLRFDQSLFVSLFSKMTLEQLQTLGKLQPELMNNTKYIRSLCSKQFRVTSLDELGKDLPKQEKRNLFFRVYSWLKDYPIHSTGLLSSALYEILQLDLELNNFDKALFTEYLKSPKQIYPRMTNRYIKEFKDSRSEVNSMIFGSERIPAADLIQTYLEAFFKENKDITPFDEYLEFDRLLEIFSSTKLMLGEALEGTHHDVLSPEKLRELAESKELTICKHNKEYFKGTEPVTITLKIKNIPSLMVKIFEFKPENYYLKEKKQLDGTINLDGLIAAEEFNIDFKEPPVQRFTKDFTFESISKKKQGIFIVDFIGNGLSSRAIIQKGKLSYLEHQTVAGQLFSIIDEETNICTGKETGIWIRGRLYRADERGHVLIPFSVNSSEKAVLVHDGFAELVDINLKGEYYEFKCAFIYNYESLLMGNKAKVLIQPRLFLNGQPIGLDIIQDGIVSVVFTNTDGVPSKLTFDDVKMSAYEETEIEIPIPAKIENLAIEAKVKIYPVNKKEPQEYTSFANISINNDKRETVISNFFLKYSHTGYEIVVVGRNGEPLKGATLKVSYQNRYLTEMGSQTLQTDSNGKVYLGKLEEIDSLEVSLHPMGDIKAGYKQWSLGKKNAINYPTNVRVCEGDKIVLPLLHNELNRHQISFVEKLSNEEVVRNCLSLLQIDKKRLVISGISEGLYELYLKDVGVKIQVTVFKGTYWAQNPNYLHAKDSLINIKTDINNIIITDFHLEPKENSELADITIRAFVDDPKLARFHLFGAQFMDADMNRTITQLQNNLPSQNVRSTIRLGVRQSQFLNNRALGDEYCYVLDRKSKPRYMGNTLEKPPILLKRTFVRDTETNEEKLKETKDFSPRRAEACYDEMSRASAHRGEGSRARSGPESFLNFLAHPCLVYSNLKPNEEGVIVVKDFPYKRYSFVQIVASNLTSNICDTFPLESPHIQTKDLTQKARKDNSVSSMKRITSNVFEGQKVEIKDIASTEFQVIDSLGRLYDYQKNLALCSSSPGNSETYSQWDFLKSWGNLTHEEKLKKYDKFASHELNLFIHYKDQDFFNKIVLPFLRNKIERTLVDYFLLQDEKRMYEFSRPENFKDLNSLEQILVIISIQDLHPEEAKKLAHLLEQKSLLIKQDADTFNRYFDTIVVAKKAGQDLEYERERRSAEESRAYSGREILKRSAAPMEMMARSAATSSTGPRFFGAAKMSSVAYDSASLERSARKPEDDYDLGGKEYLEKRKQVQSGFQELEKTKEYTERHYYEQKSKYISIPLNPFWVDAARHAAEKNFSKPFLSANFIYAHSSHTEMIAVLSLLSLPFKANEHVYTSFEDRRLEIQAGSNLMVFTKAVTEAESALKDGILVTQRFFDPQDQFTESEEEPGVRIEKDVDQYIVNKVYGASVIVTNSTASNQQVQVLVEIPEGAIPVGDSDYIKSTNMQLNAFSTQTVNFRFYFPKTGKFKGNPPSVSKKGQVIAVGKGQEIQVQTEKVYASLETLQAVLSKGSKEDVLNFARTKNIWNTNVFDFRSIYWLLKDKSFFLEFINVLRERKHYDPVVWQFGFYHKDQQTIKEYFNATPQNPVAKTVQYIESSILQVDKLQILEYHPYINQRVHLLSDEKNKILNVQFRDQYKNYVGYLCERKTLETSHYLGLVYYLLLQDRVEDAMRFFGKIDREELRKSHQHELQYDYFAAYIDFSVGHPKFAVAREICQKYINYPVLSWRSLFVEVANQLAEYDGKQTIEDEAAMLEEKKQNLTNADKEQVISMELQNSKIHITHRNVKEITLSFYRVDLEVLFSRNPFINQSKDEFSFIQPSHTEKIKITNIHDLEKQVYEIPKDLQKGNLYIELKSDYKTLSTNYFSTSLKVYVIENYGQVKVVDEEDKALSKVYVKCFAKGKNGKVFFYKDGYTDLRGRFDYATLNSNDISNIDKFAIFVMSDELGSLIKEAKAPNKLGRIEN